MDAQDSEPRIVPVLDEMVIGRDKQDSLDAARYLRIPEHTVSRRHARMRRSGDGYVIEDLHSFNGTFVNGERLAPGDWRRLRDGDEITLASKAFVFHSLIVPAAQNAPGIVTRSVDASDLTRLAPLHEVMAGDTDLAMQKLHAMAQVGIALGAVTDRETLIEKIMNFIFDLFPQAERAFMMLASGEDAAPTPVAARRRDGAPLDWQQLRISRTIVNDVVRNKRAVLSVDTLADRHYGAQESIIAQALRSVMCVPLLLEGECLGLIQVDTSSDPQAFREEDLEILTGVCAEAAVALKNFQLYSDIARLLDGFVRASVQAIEERDPVTAGHSFRVAGYAERLALAADRAEIPALRDIRFSREQMREIRYAALLHDFGKVGVREHVLRKEKKLHHADMRLLALRFQYVKACLERQAWRDLAQRQGREGMGREAFLQASAALEAALMQEFARLDAFHETIQRANEPAISSTASPPELEQLRACTYAGLDGGELRLLSDEEYAALSIAKGCLTPDERRQIEKHVVDSYSFLILIPWTRDLAGVPSIAHGHHEKLDGSGYPMGLRGSEICTQTRILTIADIFDALTAGDRPYKKAMPLEAALDLMGLECRAGHLDAALFSAFVESRAWNTQEAP
ncbi:FHA domain-containing protein [Noviherbaspirillum sp. DKR-6]|uniref:FHA domain-containing protein n=2 Tax=Noviherbaspirillum pedocola TaxID=2801341 RepID=A0A934W6N2_9BURK|nr:FHA domain-containing protein [Noviherbaspirillum pedocola]